MLSQVQTGVVSRCWGRRLTVMVMQMKRATFWLNTESMRRLSQSKRRCLHGRMCPQTCTQWSNNTGVFTHVRRAASSHRCNPEPSECCLLIQEQHHMCESSMSHGHLGGAQDKDDKRFDSGFSIMGCGCKLLQTNLSPVLRVDWGSGDQVSLKKSCSSSFDMCSWHKIKYNLFNYLGGKNSWPDARWKTSNETWAFPARLTLAISWSHRALKASSFCWISSSSTPPSISVCASSRIWFLLSSGCRSRTSRLWEHRHELAVEVAQLLVKNDDMQLLKEVN